MPHTPTAKRFALGLSAIALAVLLFAVGSATNSSAATAPGLGAAYSYAVLGGQTVTNTGPTTINGDLGVSPGTAVTGFPPGTVTNGSIHAADAHAGLAQDATTTAYNALASQPCNVDLTGQDLGGMTLTENVYCFSTSAQLTGMLTLNAQGNASAVFIFQIGSTLTTASSSTVQVINGGVDCNVFWQVGSSATIGTGTVFVGNIVALTSISLTTGASVSGRALARNGAVTLDTNDVGFEACIPPTAAPTRTPAPTPDVSASPIPTGIPTAVPTPVGQTPTPVVQTPSPTPVAQTPSPTPVVQTPSPTPVVQTPSPTPVVQTPSPTPGVPTTTPTPLLPPPAPTISPSPTPEVPLLPPPDTTNTPSPTPALPHFPNTGGPSAAGGSLPWAVLLGLTLSCLGAAAFVLSQRRNHPHQTADR